MKMAKFLNLWEVVPGSMPVDPKQRAELLGKMMEMTKKALDDHQITDWGIFPGGSGGYAIGEGTAADTLKGTMQFAPYIRFTVHPVLSLKEMADVMKSMK
jgi:hypothetical protein